MNRQRLKFYFLQFYAKFWQMELDELKLKFKKYVEKVKSKEA